MWKARKPCSLREGPACCSSRVQRLLQGDSGVSGRGLEPRGQRGRCHQFQFCPSWPEGAGDFPEWERTIRGPSRLEPGPGFEDPFPGPAGCSLQGRHRNPWRVGLSPCTPVVGPSSTTARQLQPKSMATEEFLGLVVPANEGFKGTAAPGAPEKYFQDKSGGAEWIPHPMPKHEAETTRTPQNGSIF